MAKAGMSTLPGLVLGLLSTTLIFAQSPAGRFDQAPPQVEERLRQRVSEFYQAHIDGKFREAEKYVAEDTKDFYFEQRKKRLLAFEIKEITYSEEYSKAKVTILARQHVLIPGFAGKPMDIPSPSYWKVENGDWYWWVDQKLLNQTPFGEMTGGGKGSGDPNSLPAMASLPTIEQIQKQVRAEKQRLSVAAGSQDQTIIVSQAAGEVVLRVEAPDVPGVEVALDRTELNRNEKATLTVKAAKGATLPPAMGLNIVVSPTNQAIPIVVDFAAASTADSQSK